MRCCLALWVGRSWDALPSDKRPERGLLRLRQALDLFANLRPAKLYTALIDASSLRPEVVQGIDVLVVRELVSDIYYGQPRGIERLEEGERGFNTMSYTISGNSAGGASRLRAGPPAARQGNIG